MKISIQVLITVLLFWGIRPVSGQPVVSEWTDYQSYARSKYVVDTGSKVYCVTEG